jgi:hypothetical protein
MSRSYFGPLGAAAPFIAGLLLIGSVSARAAIAMSGVLVQFALARATLSRPSTSVGPTAEPASGPSAVPTTHGESLP